MNIFWTDLFDSQFGTIDTPNLGQSEPESNYIDS